MRNDRNQNINENKNDNMENKFLEAIEKLSENFQKALQKNGEQVGRMSNQNRRGTNTNFSENSHSNYKCYRCDKKGHIARDRKEERDKNQNKDYRSHSTQEVKTNPLK